MPMSPVIPASAAGSTAAPSDYQARISGPLMDRIDLRIEVPAVTAADLILPPPAEGSAEVAARVAAARDIQLRRVTPRPACRRSAPTPKRRPRCWRPSRSPMRRHQLVARCIRDDAAGRFFRAVEVGERAGDAQHAVIAARRQPHGLRRPRAAALCPRHPAWRLSSSSAAGASALVRTCGSPAAA